MSKKHFIALAAAMKSARIIDRPQWEEDCKTLAWALAQFNAQFDRLKFLDACGVK